VIPFMPAPKRSRLRCTVLFLFFFFFPLAAGPQNLFDNFSVRFYFPFLFPPSEPLVQSKSQSGGTPLTFPSLSVQQNWKHARSSRPWVFISAPRRPQNGYVFEMYNVNSFLPTLLRLTPQNIPNCFRGCSSPPLFVPLTPLPPSFGPLELPLSHSRSFFPPRIF